MSTFLPEPQYPDDLDPSAALDVLDQRLVDPASAPPDLIVTDAPPPPLGRSWAFDFVVKRFVSSSGGIAETYGQETLRVWIWKCLQTDRGAHVIHSDDYGMERPFSMIGQQLSDVSSADLQARVTDALTKHPSIADVQSFSMSYDSNDVILYVSFVVVLADQQSLVVTGLSLS